jgi:hypothetical protein
MKYTLAMLGFLGVTCASTPARRADTVQADTVQALGEDCAAGNPRACEKLNAIAHGEGRRA